ncbi:MAG: hypothetical protein COT74_07165 [Bdellovibrionales bacterium CG10_big_fil_rev_8_21_14_0_10_45_34]|nr:MAG: hypothetical protein COT74_07165 [Bdellovibrionales bacterium CG10_big_fil_rev_8_21_14_0_10_45_34]
MFEKSKNQFYCYKSAFFSTLSLALLLAFLTAPFVLADGDEARPSASQKVVNTSDHLQTVTVGPNDDFAPVELFTQHTGVLNEFFSELAAQDTSGVIDTILANDVRRTFFNLQYLSDLCTSLDKRLFRELKQEFKEVEDAIGRVALNNDLILNVDQFPLAEYRPAMKLYLVSQRDQKARELLEVLLRYDYVSENRSARSRVMRVQEKFSQMDTKLTRVSSWRGRESSARAFFKSKILEEIKDLDGDIKDRVFDSDAIEEGLHKLRRSLRGLLIRMVALNGMVQRNDNAQLSPKISRWFGKLQASSSASLFDSKYIRLDETKVKEPIVLPGPHMAILAEIVRLIGDQKDVAEVEIELFEAYSEVRRNQRVPGPTANDLDLGRQHQITDHRAIANEYMDQLNSTKVIEALGEAIR